MPGGGPGGWACGGRCEESRGFGGPVDMLLPPKISCSNLQLKKKNSCTALIKTSCVSLEVLREREDLGSRLALSQDSPGNSLS